MPTETVVRDCDRCGEADATINMSGDGWMMWCQSCFDKATQDADQQLASEETPPCQIVLSSASRPRRCAPGAASGYTTTAQEIATRAPGSGPMSLPALPLDLTLDAPISVSEAARRLGVNRAALAVRARSGALEAVMVGRSWVTSWRRVQACSDLPVPTPQRAPKRPRSGSRTTTA